MFTNATNITRITFAPVTRQVRRWRGRRFVFHRQPAGVGSRIRVYAMLPSGRNDP